MSQLRTARLTSTARLTRRSLLSGMAALGATALASRAVSAEETIQDMLERNRVLRSTNREGNTVAALDAIDTFEPILSMDTALNLDNAIAKYQQIVQNGGWSELSRNVHGLVAGVKRDSVPNLKRRLMVEGDLAAEDRVDDLFDEKLDAAMRRYQARHGLNVTGKVDGQSLASLNVPADYRLGQVQLNAKRVANLAAQLSDRYVVVNIPAAVIEAVDNGSVFQRHTAVVGRIDRQTPILKSKVYEVNFNPYWHVPKSLIRKDLIKYMNKDPNYLAEQKIHIYDSAGNEIQPSQIDWSTDDAVNYMFRQEPGPNNSLGNVRINFHNKYSVYLHDTPTKSLFSQNERFFSSGCVRVKGVDALVAWLLRDNGYDLQSVDALFQSGERLDVELNQPVPILTTYITAWANRQGVVSFRPDVYEFDAAGKVQFDE